MAFIRIIFVLMFFSHVAFAQWVKQDSGTLAWLDAIYFVDKDNGWMAGSNGTLLLTRNGGRTWQKEKTKTGDTIRDVYFSDVRNGWLLCERSVYASGENPPSYLMRTFNGGKDWQNIEFADGKERMTRFFFLGDDTGFAVGEGGILLRMQEVSRRWKRSILPTRYLMVDAAYIDAFTIFLVGGGGTILFTTDGGSTWSESKFAESAGHPKLNSVHFADQKKGWATGGEGKIYSSDDGGKLWQEQNSHVTTDLFDIVFVDSKLGFAVGDEGTILRTANGGGNWKTEASGTRHRLERIAIAGNRAFAVGFGGIILTAEIRREGN